MLQHGAIASAGGGYSECILDCLDYRSARAVRASCSTGRDVVSRGWHAHALQPGQNLEVALTCFPTVRTLNVNGELVQEVEEDEWLQLIESGKLAHLRSLVLLPFAAQVCDYSDEWLFALCTQFPRLTHLELPISSYMTSGALPILASADHLSALDISLPRGVWDAGAIGALLQHSRALRSLSTYCVEFLPMKGLRTLLNVRRCRWSG
jgi:hypothetical protein